MYDADRECEAMIANLKKLCKQKGMTPYALAKKAGVSNSTMSYMMRGKTRPQIYTVLLLCNVLDIELSDLFQGSEGQSKAAMEGLSQDEEKLIEAYRKVSEKKKNLMRIYADMLLWYDDDLFVEKI